MYSLITATQYLAAISTRAKVILNGLQRMSLQIRHNSSLPFHAMSRATDAIKPKREILRNESYLLPGDSHTHARRDAR